MASHVTVIDNAARRHVVKTTPGTYLNDVLQEACTKFRLNPSLYGLSHKNKDVDLSTPMRLSGLGSGAKLELKLQSKTPSVVNVALQIPESEAKGAPNARLTDKFPSTTTLWKILRKFESGVAGGGDQKIQRNFTGRGVPKFNSPEKSGGRLFHEMPVLHVLGRDYASFEDLQKTLAQLGVTKGSVLLKLSFKLSDTPLEEAVLQIDGYFAKEEMEQPVKKRYAEDGSKDVSKGEASTTADPDAMEDVKPTEPATAAASASDSIANPSTPPKQPLSIDPSVTPPASSSADAEPPTSPLTAKAATTIANRPTTVFAPPTSSTPQAARLSRDAHRPQDYVPTVEHAKAHQAHLARAAQPQRLATDAELAQRAAAARDKAAAVTSVRIKVRFPDQSAVVAEFGAADAAADLYTFVRGLLRRPDEAFAVWYAGAKGVEVELPDEGGKRLIGGWGLMGATLVTVKWKAGVSAEAVKGKSLRDDIAALGKEVEVHDVPAGKDEGDEAEEEGQGKLAKLQQMMGKDKGKGKDAGKGGGVPKWLKLPGKK